MNLSCIITDDEPLARKGLKSYIEKVHFLELADICEDALQLNESLSHHKVDLLFLDIEMPHLSGIDFLRSQTNPPKVIFTTAYEQFALAGYELDVLDYLLKPISFERFLKAANKAQDYFSSRQNGSSDYFFVKCDSKLEKVVFKDILFIEALENYVALYISGRKLITHSTLKSIQASLPSFFVQTHKSFLVNTEQIDSIQGNQLCIEDFRVPISKYQKEEVLEKILSNRLLKK